MRRDRTAAGATLAALGFIVGLNGVTASASSPQADAALRYLYGQVGSNGSVAGAAGATEDTIISVADNGYDPATLTSSTGASAYGYLATQRSSITTAGGAAKYILAWVAAGKPAAIDATSLLTTLNKPAGSGGYLGANGSFHNADPAVETANTYTQALSVLADIAAGHALPAHAAAWLRCAQRSDGGFGYVINDSASSPPAHCGDTSSDTNDTGIALQALGPAGVTTTSAAAEGFLHTAQDADGGFGFTAGGPSDPDSDAVVIQGLVAIGQAPSGAAWTVAGGGNPLSNLATFADPHGSGGYVFPGKSAPDAFTTSGIPQALALKPYAASTTIATGTRPASPAPGGGGVPVPGTGIGVGGVMVGATLVIAGVGLAAPARTRRRR